MIYPEFAFVRRESFQALEPGQVESLEHTVELAQQRLDRAIADVRKGLNKSGSQADPEGLAMRIREVRRREQVLADITGLQVSVNAAGRH